MEKLNRAKAPCFKQVEKINFLEAKFTSLTNGIPLYFISGGSEQVLKIDFIFKAGKWFQTSPLVAASTNKLMQEGSANYTSMQIAEGVDKYGAFLEAEFSYDNATITLYTMSKHLSKVLTFVKEIIIFPAFSEHEFETYKKNNLEKFKVNQEKVSFLAQTEFMQLVFGANHPYGTKTVLNDFNELSLNNIKEFHTNHYNLAACTIVVAGKVTPFDINCINDFFGVDAIKKTEELPLKLTQKNGEKVKNLLHIKKEKALQSAIRIGRVFPSKTHVDYYGLQILTIILGGYFGSRLMKNIREDKGYTYGIGAGIMALQHSTLFYISTEVGANVTQNALTEIYKEIELLRTELISNNELELVKNYILGELLRSCDGPFSMASLFENVHFFGLDYHFYNNYIEKVKTITAEELLLLAQQYLKKEALKEVVVGS